MRVDSLERLETAFADWRNRKRHVRERVPEGLIAQARRVAAVHGVGAVVKAVGIDSRKLLDGMGSETPEETPAVRARDKKVAASVPGYSRIALHGLAASTPLAEIETPAGLKVKLFQVTVETISLLAALSGTGGAR